VGRPEILFKAEEDGEGMKFKSFFESFNNKAIVFDVDDTLFTTDAKVIVHKPDGSFIELTPAQFNTYEKQPEDKMDYSQFQDPELFIRTAKPTKYIKVAQNVCKARDQGRSDTKIYILTARDSSIEKALTQKLAALGITHDGFFSAGDTGAPTIAEGKKQILEKIRSMHRGRVTFFDDDEKNIALAKQIPGIHVRHVSKESLERLSESWEDEDGMGGSPDWDSLYMSHFSGVRDSARKLGIDLDSARLINSKRPSLKDIKDVSVDPKYHQWYSVGTAWLDWIQSEMPQWLAPCTYAIVLDESKMMKVNSKASIQLFRKNYISKPNAPKDMAIDWTKLYKANVDVLEFSPYLGHIGGSTDAWYDSIDMASGAIINKRCIKKIVKLYDGTEDFRDAGIKI
jgi:FMN phosphatase YigB (HAD superfamily)